MQIVCLEPLSPHKDLYLQYTCLGPGEGNISAETCRRSPQRHHVHTSGESGGSQPQPLDTLYEHQRLLWIPPGRTQSRTPLLRELSAAPPLSYLCCIHMFMSSHVDVLWLLSLSVWVGVQSQLDWFFGVCLSGVRSVGVQWGTCVMSEVALAPSSLPFPVKWNCSAPDK